MGVTAAGAGAEVKAAELCVGNAIPFVSFWGKSMASVSCAAGV